MYCLFNLHTEKEKICMKLEKKQVCLASKSESDYTFARGPQPEAIQEDPDFLQLYCVAAKTYVDIYKLFKCLCESDGTWILFYCNYHFIQQ